MSQCLHGIFNIDNLTLNIKKLEQYYQKKISPDQLDERHFITKDVKNLTPFKLSPYARNSHLPKPQHPGLESPILKIKQPGGDSEIPQNEQLEPPTKRVQASRMLNYDQASYEHISLKQKINEVKFPVNVPNSPYSIKQVIPATPISMIMELKNWLK